MNLNGKSSKWVPSLDHELVVQEALYGFVMALTFVIMVQIGFISFGDRSDLILAMFAMDFVWGIIDMVVFLHVDYLSFHRSLTLLASAYAPNKNSIDELREEIDSTVFGLLDDEAREKAVNLVLDSMPDTLENIKPDYRDSLFNGLTSFVVTVLSSLPAILCVWAISDYSLALKSASVISSIALFFVSYLMSPYESKLGKISVGITTTAIGLIFTVFAAYFGG